MLFIGHFSFDEHGDPARFGYFTCIIEAKNAAATETAFRKLITTMRKQGKLFSGALDIYLDALIEVGEIPKGGLITWYSAYHEDGLSRLSTTLPHEETGGVNAYEYLPDDRPEVKEKMLKRESSESAPFISFTEPIKKGSGKEAKNE